MRTKYVTGITVTDLGNTIPFAVGGVVAVLNPGSSAVTLQFGDASTGPFSTGRTADGLTPAVIAAGGSLENVLISGRYAALEGGSGQLQLVQN